MTEAQGSEKERNVQTENVHLGYQTAVSIWTYHGELVWAKYNALLVANSIIVAAAGLAYTSGNPLPVISNVFPLVGLVLCAIWFILTKRGVEYFIYFVLSARELEEKHLSSEIKLLSRGAIYGEGEPVTFEIAGNSVTRRMSVWARLLRTETASHLVILVFAVLYVAIMIENIR